MKKIVLGVSAVALALVLGVSAVSAQTATTQTTVTTTATFARDLTIGSTGADVTALQAMLIANGKLMIAAPTGYFGTMTKTALASWQMSVGITPASGYFGPITRAYIASHSNMSTGSTTTTTTSTVPGCSAGAMFSATTGKSCSGSTTTTTTSTSNNNKNDDLSGGEASLEDLNARDGDDDDVEEGGKGDIAEFEFDVEDADIEIERLDLSFETDASGSDEDEPWNTFEKITIMDEDGEELASEDVSDEDDWLENDDSPYEFRFNDLNYVVKEGDKGTLKVQVEAQDGIDGAEDDISWTVFIDEEGLRGTDGEDIEQYLGDEDETVSFDITEEGEDDDLSVRRNSDDPESTTFQVEDDGVSDWYTVFVFDLDSDEDSDDIEINDLPITFTTNDRIGDVYNDVKIKIDGKEFDMDESFSSSTATTASTTFDIDGDVVIEGGERMKVEVMAEFKTASTTSTYPNGTTVSASVIGSQIDAEGSDDIDVTGSVSGDTHTLNSSGIDVDVTDTSAEVREPDGVDNNVVTFNVKADIEAFEQDAYIRQAAASAFTYQIENASTGAVVATGTSTPSLSSSADTETAGGNTYYVVNEQSEESFTFQVTYNPSVSGDYRLQVLTIIFNDDASTSSTMSYTAEPASDFESESKFINAD